MMRIFSGCNFYHSILYEKIMVYPEKQKKSAFMQSEKVDPDTHLYILL